MVETRDAYYRIYKHYSQLLKSLQDQYEKGGNDFSEALLRFEKAWANIQLAHDWAVLNFQEDYRAAELCFELNDYGKYFYDIRQDPEESLSWLEAGLEAAHKLSDRGMIAIQLSYMGDAYDALSQTDKAIACYLEAISIATKENHSVAKGLALYGLCWAYYNSGDYPNAIKTGYQSLAISRESGNRRDMSYDYSNLGSIYIEMGEYQKAIKLLKKALTINRETEDRQAEGATVGSLGEAYLAMGDPKTAINYLEQAIQIQDEIKDEQNKRAHLISLAEAYFTIKQGQKSIDLYNQVINMSIKSGDKRSLAICLQRQSIALKNLDRLEEAIVSARAALNVFYQIHDPRVEEVEAVLDTWLVSI